MRGSCAHALAGAALAALAALGGAGAARADRVAAAAPGAAAAAASLQSPRWTRAEMEALLPGGPRFLIVYGTQVPASTASLRAEAARLAGSLLGAAGDTLLADRDVSADSIAAHPVVLVGAPRENLWTRRLAPALPVQFHDGAFRWAGHDYGRPDEALRLVYPNPLDPRRFLLLVAANGAAALAQPHGFFFGDEDWRIERAGELLRSGTFAQSKAAPWRYEPALDRDREREAAEFSASLRHWTFARLEVEAPPDLPHARERAQAAADLLMRLDSLGFAAPAGAAPRLTLYRSLEQKGVFTHNTRPEFLIEPRHAALALPAGWERSDLWSIVALRLTRLGASTESPLLEPASAWLSGRWGGEPLERAIARLYFSGLLPTAREAASRSSLWRSPLVMVPARAVLAGAVFQCAGPRSRAALLGVLTRSPPGTIDSLCRAAGIDRARLERRYTMLSDSLARAGQRLTPPPAAGNPLATFARGVCLAHSVSLERGYLSDSCARELRHLAPLGVDWVSISPFGFLPSARAPVIEPSADGGENEETDEAVCEAAARAHALGMRVLLAPHLWTRGFSGALEFGASGWPHFFDEYRAFLLHYAVLAEREHMDALEVGHELPTASLPFPDRWRELIGEARRVYHGPITYGAGWDREAAAVGFWDACDVIGVSFYAPLAARPGADAAELVAGARRALAGLHDLARRSGRPVLLVEAGYPALPEAAVRPWEESRREAADTEAQRACYQALLDALDPEDWLAGVFVWKWPSGAQPSGPSDASFTPRGKPAEAVMGRAFNGWRDRPVRAPVPRKP
jgi:hypothetical protein